MSKSQHMLRADEEAGRVLKMRDEGMTLRDIADRLGWSLSKVNRREVRAKKNMGKTLAQCESQLKELWQIIYTMRVEVADLKARTR